MPTYDSGEEPVLGDVVRYRGEYEGRPVTATVTSLAHVKKDGLCVVQIDTMKDPWPLGARVSELCLVTRKKTDRMPSSDEETRYRRFRRRLANYTTIAINNELWRSMGGLRHPLGCHPGMMGMRVREGVEASLIWWISPREADLFCRGFDGLSTPDGVYFDLGRQYRTRWKELRLL